MTKTLAFENTEWVFWVIIGAIIIWLVFIWKEKHNYPSLKFLVNTIVSLITMSALALLILKPLKYASNKPFKLAVLTKGFKEKQLDSLKKLHDDLVTSTYDPEQKLLKDNLIPETVYVLGNGIKEYDLWQLEAIKTMYLAGNEPKGVIHINYNNQNKKGNQAIFRGRYINASIGHRLILETPDKKAVDSIIFEDSNNIDFQLEANLKAQGRFLYHLTEKDSLGTIVTSDPLPITVSGEEHLKILVINDFPTFETKYLKNYLAEQGHEVAIRSQITKNRYKYEYFNTSSKLNTALSQKNLNQFDLLIIDATTLNKLSRSSRNSIKESVSDSGLGIYIQADVSFFGLKNNLANFRFNRNTLNSVKLASKQKATSVFPYDFKNGLSMQSIHVDKSKIITAYKQLGLGKVGASVIKNSYELVLNGHKNTYQDLWTDIIETISKKNTTTANWNSTSHIAFKNEPFTFTLAAQTPYPSIINRDSLKYSLRQDINIPTLWEGTTYPNTVGWQTLLMEQDSTIAFKYYVTDSTKWQALRAYQTIKNNKQQFDFNKPLKNATLKSAEAIDLTWLYVIFIVSIGYLWLQPKL